MSIKFLGQIYCPRLFQDFKSYQVMSTQVGMVATPGAFFILTPMGMISEAQAIQNGLLRVTP